MYKGQLEKIFKHAKTGLFYDLFSRSKYITTKEACSTALLLQFVFSLKFYKPSPSCLKAG